MSKLIDDEELSALYEEAVRRMGNDRFVRNQRRLLKKFFIDLKAQARTNIQREAIKVLRGRHERTSIADQIWSIINPSNPARREKMAALGKQKVDKRLQLERMLGGTSNLEDQYEPEEEVKSNPSEESEDSISDGSDFLEDESNYPNIEKATEFLVGGKHLFAQSILDFITIRH